MHSVVLKPAPSKDMEKHVQRLQQLLEDERGSLVTVDGSAACSGSSGGNREADVHETRSEHLLLRQEVEQVRSLLRWNVENKAGFVSAGGVRVLVHMVRHLCALMNGDGSSCGNSSSSSPSLAPIVELGVTCLYNLTNSSEGVCQILIHGGLEALFDALSSGGCTHKSRENSAAALFMVVKSGSCSEEQMKLCAALGVAPLAALLKSAPGLTGRTDASLALFALTCDDLCRQFTIMAGVADVLVTQLEGLNPCDFFGGKSACPPVPPSTSRSAEFSSSGKGVLPGAAKEPRGAQPQKQQMKVQEKQHGQQPPACPGDCSKFEESAVAVLANLTMCAEGCSAVAAAGGISSLAQVVEMGWSDKAREQAVQALLNIACCDEEYLPTIAAEGLMLPLVGVMSLGGTEGAGCTVGARGKECDGSGRVAARQRSAGAAAELLEILRAHSASSSGSSGTRYYSNSQ